MTKTNAARILDKHGIEYELLAYDVDETDLSAITVASKIGQDINMVFKTLVLRGDKTGVLVTVIPGGKELDLKKAAKASGNKNVEMVAMKEILELTGYPGRMFANWHEKKISCLYSRELPEAWFYFYKCRNERLADEDST